MKGNSQVSPSTVKQDFFSFNQIIILEKLFCLIVYLGGESNGCMNRRVEFNEELDKCPTISKFQTLFSCLTNLIDDLGGWESKCCAGKAVDKGNEQKHGDLPANFTHSLDTVSIFGFYTGQKTNAHES